MEITNENVFYIRAALCNPEKELFKSLFNFFEILLNKNRGKLKDLHSKLEYDEFNEDVQKLILESYNKRKNDFVLMYGGFTAPIGTDEFNKIKNKYRIPYHKDNKR